MGLSSGHGAGGCGCRGAEGCLDHVNGLCVAHLLQGLHQLFDGTPRDLVGKGRVCSCVPACLQAVSINGYPFSVSAPESWGVGEGTGSDDANRINMSDFCW